MNFRLSSGLAALGGVLLASCTPYQETPPPDKTPATPETTATTPDPLKLKEQEELKKKEAEELAKNKAAENPTTTTQPTTEKQPKAPTEAKRDYAFANKVPGKDGFVFSPYNNKVVDVRDIPSGTLVQDPTYPAVEKKYFRVP